MDGLNISRLKTIWWPTSELISFLSNKGRLSEFFMVAMYVIMDVPCDGMTILIDASLDICRDTISDVSMDGTLPGWSCVAGSVVN